MLASHFQVECLAQISPGTLGDGAIAGVDFRRSCCSDKEQTVFVVDQSAASIGCTIWPLVTALIGARDEVATTLARQALWHDLHIELRDLTDLRPEPLPR